MTFYIMAKSIDTGDEWVAETFDTRDYAEQCLKAMLARETQRDIVYRIDYAHINKPGGDGEDPKRLEHLLDRAYPAKPIICPEFHCALPANHPGQHQCGLIGCEAFPPEPPEKSHIRTEDFTLDELFPRPAHIAYVTQACEECGALVNEPQRVKHVAWHNKLLP